MKILNTNFIFFEYKCWLPISLISEFLLYHIMFVCRLGTPLAAEELNTVVGTAFRVAYAAQLQSQKVQFLNS